MMKAMTNMRPAVFLDRDGTLMVERSDPASLGDPQQVALETRVIPALQQLQAAGYPLIVVTNQSGIGRGLYTVSDYERVTQRLADLLADHHITLTATYHCPHHPTHAHPPYRQVCQCRKPNPGLIEQGMAAHGISPDGSWMIGDRLTDMMAGQAVGIPGILLLTGNGSHDAPHWHRVAPTLWDAVTQWVLPRRV